MAGKQGRSGPPGNLNAATHGAFSERRPKALGGKGLTRLDGRTRTYRRWKRHRDAMLAQLPETRRRREEFDLGLMAFCRLKLEQMMEHDLANPRPVGKKGLAPPCGNQFLAYLGHYTRGMSRLKLDGWGGDVGLDLTEEVRRLEAEQGNAE